MVPRLGMPADFPVASPDISKHSVDFCHTHRIERGRQILASNCTEFSTFGGESLKSDGTLDKLAKKYLADAWGADPTKIPYIKP